MGTQGLTSIFPLLGIFLCVAPVRVHAGAALCRAPGRGNDPTLAVHIDEDNIRKLVLDESGAAQTAIACRGTVPTGCVDSQPARSASHSFLDTDDSSSTVASCFALQGADCPCDPDNQNLLFPYMQAMASSVTERCTAQPTRVLMVGFGAGALPSNLVSSCPSGNLHIESVEVDPRVVSLAQRFFGFKPQPGVNEVEVSDGFDAVLSRANQGVSYDVVLVDCFGENDEVPAQCRSGVFLSQVHQILKPGGMVMQNIWGRSESNPNVARDFKITADAYRGLFASVHEEVTRDVPHCTEALLVAKV